MHCRDDGAVPRGFGTEVRPAQRENCRPDALSEKLGNFPIAKGLGKFREPFKNVGEHLDLTRSGLIANAGEARNPLIYKLDARPA